MSRLGHDTRMQNSMLSTLKYELLQVCYLSFSAAAVNHQFALLLIDRVVRWLKNRLSAIGCNVRSKEIVWLSVKYICEGCQGKSNTKRPVK